MFAKIKSKLARAHTSLTIWFNSAVGVILFNLPELQLVFPQMREFLPANWYQYAMGFIIFANILIRFKTSKSLESK